MKSNFMSALDAPQVALDLRPKMRDVDMSTLLAQTSLLGAIKLCITLRGFDVEKQVHGPLSIDAGHWSRILKAQAHFPVDKLPALMDLCENEAPLLWLLNARGYDLASLRPKETESQRALRIALEEVAQLKAERAIERRAFAEVLAGRAPA